MLSTSIQYLVNLIEIQQLSYGSHNSLKLAIIHTASGTNINPTKNRRKGIDYVVADRSTVNTLGAKPFLTASSLSQRGQAQSDSIGRALICEERNVALVK